MQLETARTRSGSTRRETPQRFLQLGAQCVDNTGRCDGVEGLLRTVQGKVQPHEHAVSYNLPMRRAGLMTAPEYVPARADE